MLPYSKLLFANHKADYTALASFTSEASLLAGNSLQPTVPIGLFDGPDAVGRTLLLEVEGVLGSTGTPTYTFTVRFGSTIAAITDAAIASSAALTTASGISTKWWRLWLRIVCRTPGQGAANTTFSVDGFVESPGGLAAPYKYALTQAGGESGTWTVAPANFNPVVQNYLNVSVACSASSASNTITAKNATLSLIG